MPLRIARRDARIAPSGLRHKRMSASHVKSGSDQEVEPPEQGHDAMGIDSYASAEEMSSPALTIDSQVHESPQRSQEVVQPLNLGDHSFDQSGSQDVEQRVHVLAGEDQSGPLGSVDNVTAQSPAGDRLGSRPLIDSLESAGPMLGVDPHPHLVIL